MKEDWNTPGARLRWAIEQRPHDGRERGVRKFCKDLQARSEERKRGGGKPISGVTLVSIMSYLPTATREALTEPRRDFLEEAADLCGVSRGWLMSGDGYPTAEHARANAHALAAAPDHERTRRVLRSDIPQLNWPDSSIPPWAGLLGEIQLRLKIGGSYRVHDAFGIYDADHSGNSPIDQMVGQDLLAALRGPLAGLRIDPAAMDRATFDMYMTMMIPVLLMLADVRRKQLPDDHLWSDMGTEVKHRGRIRRRTKTPKRSKGKSKR